jgi:glycerol-3-phosphate acyltransferase PlsX
MVRVALDAMGGDIGPAATVAGAAKASLEPGDLSVLLVGAMDRIGPVLDSVPHDPTRLALHHAASAIPMGADPREAVRRQPDSSIAVALDLLANREVDAVVTAGNTGAAILAASARLDRLPGVRRAALASVYPTEKRRGPRGDPFALMLDVGATLTATSDDLVGFAAMGAAYSAIVSEIHRPRVALLANGTEPSKGTPAIVEAHRRLARSSLNFAGNVEGLDIPRGTVDVVVCDGFLGNVVLKMLEGVGGVLRDMARAAAGRRMRTRLGLSLLGEDLRKLGERTDWKVYGGAPVLGFDGLVIKAHGRSEAHAIRNALRLAAKSVRGDLTRRIAELMEPEPSP